MNIDERLADILKIYSPENKDLIPDTIVLLKALMVDVVGEDDIRVLKYDYLDGKVDGYNQAKQEIRDRINKESE